MILSQFMPPYGYAKAKGKGRDRTTYRGARRNIAKIDYRRAKRQRQAIKNAQRA